MSSVLQTLVRNEVVRRVRVRKVRSVGRRGVRVRRCGEDSVWRDEGGDIAVSLQ